MNLATSDEMRARIDEHLRAARQAFAAQRFADADAAFKRVLELDSDNLDALRHLGVQALARGAFGDALHWLDRAAALDRSNAQILKNLGLAYIALKRPDEARFVLERAVLLDPRFFLARLHLAMVQEEIGHAQEALINYYAAVTQAQAKGRWLNDDTTPASLRGFVLHAMSVIDAGRKQLFIEALEPLRAQHGEAALERVMRCLDVYLETEPANYPDPRQRPKFLYFPGLPTSAYFERALFPWYAELESNVALIRDELSAVLNDNTGIEPFLNFKSPADAANYLAGTDAAPTWDAFFFYRHGVRNDENCARCPRTAGIIDALPLVHIRDHAPEICFSLLTPGTHILPHRGVTNTRLVTHLPLIVPENCALNVGGELRVWQEGECFTFDDTYEHEAWNRGSSTRVVMLMDCWNPHLTPVEREAVTLLVGAIGDFNRQAGVAEH